MKNLFKCALILLCMQLCVATSFAQKHKKAIAQKSNTALVGVWELSQLSSNGSDLVNAGPGALKIFSADGSFSNVQYGQQGAAVTHSGSFKIISDKDYVETIAAEMPDATYALAGKIYKTGYLVSDDKKLLTVTGAVEGKNGQPGLTYTEVWRRL